MLPGVVFSAVAGGSAGAAVSVLSGHPPAITLLIYSAAGCCSVLAFLWQALGATPRVNRS